MSITNTIVPIGILILIFSCENSGLDNTRGRQNSFKHHWNLADNYHENGRLDLEISHLDSAFTYCSKSSERKGVSLRLLNSYQELEQLSGRMYLVDLAYNVNTDSPEENALRLLYSYKIYLSESNFSDAKSILDSLGNFIRKNPEINWEYEMIHGRNIELFLAQKDKLKACDYIKEHLSDMPIPKFCK